MKQVFSLAFLLLIMSCASKKNTSQTELKTNSTLVTHIADISIEGMACQEGCADTIQANLTKIEGVNAAVVKYESGRATIEFIPSMVSSDEIQETITSTKVKDYNYTINNITINTKP